MRSHLAISRRRSGGARYRAERLGRERANTLTGGCATGPRLRGDLTVRPAQALGGDRRAPHRRSEGRPGDRDLQPGVRNPDLAGRRHAQCVLLEYRDPSTPVVVARAVSGAEPGPGERVSVVRLADLDPAQVDMRTMLIIGSSQTQWYAGRLVGDTTEDRVFTPRHYPAGPID